MVKIPGDTGKTWRLAKFVEYQHKVPPIHPITCVEYAKRNELTPADCVWLSWLVSVTYCEITAIFMFELLDWRTIKPSDVTSFWVNNKEILIFGSARKHAKNMDWFVPLVSEFMKLIKREPYGWVKSLEGHEPVETYARILAAVKKVKYTGRFASDLFMEMLVAFNKAYLIDLELKEPDTLDWKHCSNLTSGLLNMIYKDDEADEYDKTGFVSPENIELLNKRIRQVQQAILYKYPDQDVTLPLVIGKICSFRNLFKGARYGGFHHDRQLENLLRYKNCRKGYPLWNELFQIRKALFEPQLLGELGGWTGIRKERKKLWLEKGLTGVEAIGKH